MMDDKQIRTQIHQAVDVHGASLQENPFLAQQLIARAQRKEGPHMKKLSTGMLIVIVLMLLSVTALAVSLTIDEIWHQSFEKMGTTGVIWNIGEPTEKDLTLDEAAAIARKAIQDKFGVTDEELDAMGFYPTYIEAEVDDGIPYPSSWRFFWSSRTNVDIDMDYDDHGPQGEYRVYMHGETGEVDTCIFYTNNFWDYAQRIWDCGSYDTVYSHYKRTDFYNQPHEVQAYWQQQLAEQGYEVVPEGEKLHQVLLSADLDLQFCELSQIADNSDPLVAAAWQALEDQCGVDAELLRKYAYVATCPAWNTGYDDVCIHYAYELEWDMMEKGCLDIYSDYLICYANRMGMYMVSFEPGTTDVAAVTHVPRSDMTLPRNVVTEGGMLARTDWSPADLVAFDEAYTRLDTGVRRMRAAGLDDQTMHVILMDYLHKLGIEEYPTAPDDLNADQWFSETSDWDALVVAPEMTYQELVDTYGMDARFWPLEIQAAYVSDSSLPKEGEMTLEEATGIALQLIVDTYGQDALDALGDYTIGCRLYRFTNEGDCIRWHIYVTDDPQTAQNGYTVVIPQRDGNDWGVPQIKLITDMSNG